jgi:hypothetical protein
LPGSACHGRSACHLPRQAVCPLCNAKRIDRHQTLDARLRLHFLHRASEMTA